MATHTVVLDTLTQHDQPISKSILNANPDAADGALKGFVSRLNALTTNNLITATRVVKTDLDSEEFVMQTTPTLTLAQTSIPWSQIQGQVKLIDINYTGDGTLSVDDCVMRSEFSTEQYPGYSIYRIWSHKIVYVDGAPKLWLYGVATYTSEYLSGRLHTGKVLASETAASAPVEVEFTFT